MSRCGIAHSPFSTALDRALSSRATSAVTRDLSGRRCKSLQRSDPLLQPPAIFRRPVLEARVDAEVVGPVVGDVGIELRLAADRDQIGLAVAQNGFGLLRFEDDT